MHMHVVGRTAWGPIEETWRCGTLPSVATSLVRGSGPAALPCFLSTSTGAKIDLPMGILSGASGMLPDMSIDLHGTESEIAFFVLCTSQRMVG